MGEISLKTLEIIKEIETYFEEGNDEDFETFADFLMEHGYGKGSKKVGKHKITFLYHGQPGSPDAEIHDGSSIQWVVELDGKLFAFEGTYSSWDSTVLDLEWIPVKKKTKTITYYG